MAVLEVFAAQTPIVATGVGGVGEAATGGETGLPVEADDPSALGPARLGWFQSSLSPLS